MKKILILIAMAAVSSGCVASKNFREVVIQKDASGKVIGSEYTERQEQRVSVMPFDFKYLTD
jgi:hypothetical protein